MRKIIFLFFIFSILLSACAPAIGSQPSLTASPVLTQSLDLAVTPTQIATLAPNATWTPDKGFATSTITLLSTIAPTFHAPAVVTATPAPKAVCPRENPDLTIDLGLAKTRACYEALTNGGDFAQCFDYELQKKILNYLNQGGNIKEIISQLIVDNRQESLIFQDLTNDGIKDFVFRNTDSPYAGYYFYTCKNGTYKVQTLGDTDPKAYLISIQTIKDLNANGIPEIIVTDANILFILEWDGNLYKEILLTTELGATEFSISDVDGNGAQDIILSRGSPPFLGTSEEFPWRYYVSIYSWNGSSYVRVSKVFNAPIYRFQAIQDADQYLILGDYQKAILLYQGAIFNKNLQWWSYKRRDYEYAKYVDAMNEDKFYVPVAPEEDLTEYPRLAAYAYYRMMILHTYLGEIDAAQIQYSTLQNKFQAGNPGYPYVEMATAFLNVYKSSGKMYDACAAAISYADVHPEILIPLGSDYHGSQSHQYVPADVCPFR
jgi:hypothetical protein